MLVQIMACHLLVTSHYLNQYWLIISWTLMVHFVNVYMALSISWKYMIDTQYLPDIQTLWGWIYLRIHKNCIHCLSFFNTELVLIFSPEREEHIHPKLSITWLLMARRCMEPGHQQPWYYWPISSEILPFQHQKANIFFIWNLMIFTCM